MDVNLKKTNSARLQYYAKDSLFHNTNATNGNKKRIGRLMSVLLIEKSRTSKGIYRFLNSNAATNIILKITVISLAKVSDWNSFRVNQNYSDSFRYLYPSQCESFRTNSKNFLYLVWWKKVKNRSDLIRINPRQLSEWIRTNPKSSFQSRSIKIYLSSDWSKPNFKSESIRIISTLDSFGLKIRFGTIRAQIDSDWSGLKTWFWIGSDSFG